MALILKLISGGFLAGYRTYLMGGLLAGQSVVAWVVGGTTLAELVAQLPEILAGLGLMSLRAGVGAKESKWRK